MKRQELDADYAQLIPLIIRVKFEFVFYIIERKRLASITNAIGNLNIQLKKQYFKFHT